MARDIIVEAIDGGAASAQRTLRIATKKIKNLRPANRQVSRWLMRWYNENFKTEGGKVGGWAPFKHGGRLMPGGKIDTSAKLLQDSGRLRLSVKPYFTRTEAGIFSKLRYSITHELGFPHRSLPARRMLPIGTDKDVVAGVTRIYKQHVNKATR